MYSIAVHREFCAAHALTIGGRVEALHGHNWLVEAVIEGAELDEDGLLCDFHRVEAVLDEILGEYNNANLNEIEPFDRVNPSAEHVARHIAKRLGERLGSGLGSARVSAVSVSEAPGCVATYRLGT